MESISVPKTLEEWNEDKIKQIINYPGIESESLDFKTKPNDLHEHFCAMANTKGGFLILGIDEIKSNDGTKLLGYKIKSFEKGKEESINQQIRNAISLLEPTPNMKFNHMYFDQEFITIIEFKNEISKKPFMLKNTNQFFVRIKDSTRLASRSTIQMLFSASIEQQKQVENLQIASEITIEAFKHALSDLHRATWESVGKIPPIDLTFLRNSTSTCAWLIRENNLLGKHTSQTSHEIGMHSILHDLEFLNVHIYAYNLAKTNEERQSLASYLQDRGLGSSYEENTIEFLEKIITITEEFLKKYQ